MTVGEASAAFPRDLLRRKRLIQGVVGGDPVAILMLADTEFARGFRRTVGGQVVVLRLAGDRLRGPSGWSWTLDGAPVSAPAALEPLLLVRSYWFGWVAFHPTTSLEGS